MIGPFAIVVPQQSGFAIVAPPPQQFGFVALVGSSPVRSSTPTNVIPTGAIDGVNTVFTLPSAPTLLLVFQDGQLLDSGDYGVSGLTITFTIAPLSGSTLAAIYWT